MNGKMTKERWLELMQPFAENDGINLTQEEIEAGYHWCEEWDGLLIHVDDDEFDCCGCSWMEKFRTPERMEMFRKRMEERYGSQEAMDKIAKLDEEMGLNPGQDALDYFANLKYEADENNNNFKKTDME
jgi:hypothetical protein